MLSTSPLIKIDREIRLDLLKAWCDQGLERESQGYQPPLHRRNCISQYVSTKSKREELLKKVMTFSHQKTSSLVLHTTTLLKKIQQFENSLEKTRTYSKNSTENESIDFYLETASDNNSEKSDDSLNLLRDQVTMAKLCKGSQNNSHPRLRLDCLDNSFCSRCEDAKYRESKLSRSLGKIGFLHSIMLLNFV
ncbi:hypothetical protein SteCoe_16968 [Stentor coeruleus]|uniref:Uncharacterized protein n=1 Tax=Stentor coeruleus TaxID=5963 RepID=A0A1R2C067_9CILI|nr:hypothetical protein SteCoe_16968 [Stentor coeruleus]